MSKTWWRAAAIRAAKTMAQTAAAMLPVTAVVWDVDWLAILSGAALAGLLSLLTSIGGLPEVDKEVQ